jgi:translocation and assembly module TamB
VTTSTIERLELAGRWDGATGVASLAGRDRGGGTLHAIVRATGAQRDVDVIVRAERFDLAPLSAVLPGAAAGIGGRLDADLHARGSDPRTAELVGTAHLVDARLPISPAVGTLAGGDARIAVRDRVLVVDLHGSLGKGNVSLAATAPLAGAQTTAGKLALRVDKVQLIGRTEPIVTATIDADITRDGDHWRAGVHVRESEVRIPSRKGEELREVGVPRDVVFGDPDRVREQRVEQRRERSARGRSPTKPVLVATFDLAGTRVIADEFRGRVGGKLTVTVGVDGIGAVGSLAVESGEATLFDRRFHIDRASLSYDGSLDPELDIRITHDYPDVSLTAALRGRLSKPTIELSSDPATHSQEEMLGWLLGGEPGGDPRNAPSATERVAGTGASLVANMIGGYVKRALPIDIDVLRYEAATASSSAAIMVGTWLTRDLFVAFRTRIAPRPDENTGEGAIEYWFRRRLVIEGTAGDRGYNGVDLLWRNRW